MSLHFVGCRYNGPKSSSHTVHFKAFLMYLLMVDGLISRERFLAICLSGSTEVTSSSSSVFFSRYTAISVVILDFAPQRCWSCSPRPEDHWNIRTLLYGCAQCYSTFFLHCSHDLRNVHALFPEMNDLLPLVHRKIRCCRILHFVDTHSDFALHSITTRQLTTAILHVRTHTSSMYSSVLTD